MLAAGGGLRGQVPGRRLVPLVLGLSIFPLMSTWARGRTELRQALQSEGLALEPFLESLQAPDAGQARVPRTAVHPVANPDPCSQALLYNLGHYQGPARA